VAGTRRRRRPGWALLALAQQRRCRAGYARSSFRRRRQRLATAAAVGLRSGCRSRGNCFSTLPRQCTITAYLSKLSSEMSYTQAGSLPVNSNSMYSAPVVLEAQASAPCCGNHPLTRTWTQTGPSSSMPVTRMIAGIVTIGRPQHHTRAEF
jgi:hypothetical protein